MRAAVVGTGFGAAHLAWLRECAEIRIGALSYRSTKSRAVDLAARFEVPEITPDASQLARSDDIDLLVITSPPDTHAALAVAVLERGGAVLCEKPLAHTVADAEAMARAADRPGARAGVVFQWRENPAFQAAREHALGGDLGEPYFVDVAFHHDFMADGRTPWPWRHDPGVAGAGALGDLGAHAFDLLRWTTGREWSVTSAVRRAPVVRTGPAGEPIAARTDDIADCRLTAGDGLPARVLVSRVSTGLRRFSITIAGSRGTLHAEADPTDGSGFLRAGAGPRRDHPPTGMNPYPRLIRAFAGAAEPVPGFADGLAVQRLIDRAVNGDQATVNGEQGTWTSADR
ncbi:Gfo/Idh/MocA family oxidoreductase [Spongiactinospora sp. TRM90649]|uniref:Gfo/Idh/MocA family protein n=1 Tax=Spongiactinospora sp. TRM90649 TaxID=3031114 RepID=UPI0023F6AE9B|nr:Gfo/Idh/MocA family oxidoreductase [Spongiactinospora sp. TRM90649]MDF5751638.1 Gfo/Idh/MocA family oxidoreductase [Spongiactinospora sp. TRM90649]